MEGANRDGKEACWLEPLASCTATLSFTSTLIVHLPCLELVQVHERTDRDPPLT